jgi:hypothetical protein
MERSPSDDDHPEQEREIEGILQEIFYGRLVPGRECGTCVACCKILLVDETEFQKPANVLCPHNTGTGCGIHATRPDICRTWFCLWRRIAGLPDHLRPDRCGVVFSLHGHEQPRNVFERIYIVAHAIEDSAVFQMPPVKAALDLFAKEGSMAVYTRFNEFKELYYPPFPLVDAIVRPNETPWQSLVPLAFAWRKRYGLD